VSGEIAFTGDELAEPLAIPWSFTPVRNIVVDTGP
jgi:hypothetical protein